MDNKYEPKAGETFNFHDIGGLEFTLRTIEGRCVDCDLMQTQFCGSDRLLCLPEERSDKKHVAFKRVVEWKKSR